MIEAVIIDDEPKNVKILRSMLTEFCPQVIITGDADNARTGYELIVSQKPNLVFLDIEMPYGNGFDLLNQLTPASFEVIFVSAFDKYLLQAFKYAALDFLLKPVNIDELKAAVLNAEKRIQKQAVNQHLSLLLDNFRKPSVALQKIAIPTTEGFDFIFVNEIIRCEAQGAYTEIYIKDSKKILVSKPLKDYESLLPEDIFFRIHNSHLINLNFIKKYNKGRGGFVELDDGAIIEVAVRRKEDFLKRFGNDLV
jgi:two-component system, LytTR family, response regulator